MAKRRTYTKEFKIEAVELADEIGNSAQAERDLGIPHGQIYMWRKKFNEEEKPGTSPAKHSLWSGPSRRRASHQFAPAVRSGARTP